MLTLSTPLCLYTNRTTHAHAVNASANTTHLPIELDVGFLGFVDEHRVRHAVLADPRVDALDPQPAEVSLLVLPGEGERDAKKSQQKKYKYFEVYI